jgi:phospholipid transport system substrate-binding protein
VPLDSQLLDLRVERLPGYAQFGSSTGGPPDDAVRLS